MKIYFAGSIRGGSEDAELYQKLIQHLKQYGQVLTEHIVDKTTTHMGSAGNVEDIFEKDMEMLKQSDIVVAEVTVPSLGVGFEIAEGIRLGKRILCLYRPEEDKSLSAMISGNKNIILKRYKDPYEASLYIDSFINDIM